ncbi:MAG: hypothetical protein DRQ41_00785, partial [Gammaproteobacteria bacterium]
MFIRKLQLTNFKRFTDLTIDLSVQTLSPPKLVLIIGINGSGKSGIFDAFEAVSSQVKDGSTLSSSYYRKNAQTDFQVRIELTDQTLIMRHDNQKGSDNVSPTAFYGRSSLRQVPQLTRTALGQGKPVNFAKDSDRPKMYIERDKRFENDLDKITGLILKDFYRSDQTASQIKPKYMNPISEAFTRIFGDNSATQLTLL